MSESIYYISGESTPTLREVGGKGLSLIKMKQFGLPVPDGFILTVEFLIEIGFFILFINKSSESFSHPLR